MVIKRCYSMLFQKRSICRTYKPGSVEFYHLSTAVVADDLYRPTPRQRTSQPLTVGIFGLSTHKACHHAHCWDASWALTSRFHPYRPCGRRFVFCGALCGAVLAVLYPFPLGSMAALCCPDFPLARVLRLRPAIEQSDRCFCLLFVSRYGCELIVFER